MEQGFHRFLQRFAHGKETPFWQAVSLGQKPKALVLACADSRVDPALVFDAQPGELFVIRNVAALVPPPADSHHLAGVSAALEFGICQLRVPLVVVMGHSLCAGVRAFLEGNSSLAGSYLGAWLQLLAPLAAERACGTLEEEEVGRRAVALSLERLQAFPFVNNALAEKRLSLLGLYFRLQHPALEVVASYP
jgi:carbonic anhydrase